MAAVIVDIDGTLADTRHRLHHLAKTPKDWKGFYDQMGLDTPYDYVIEVVNALSVKYLVVAMTGRPEEYREITRAWLDKYNVAYAQLMMRKSKDFRADTIVKKEMLDVLRQQGGDFTPVLSIDDRPEVVQMWRDNKIPCLQVDASPWYAPIKDNQDLVEWLKWMKSQHHDLMFERCADEIENLRDKVAELEIRLYGVSRDTTKPAL